MIIVIKNENHSYFYNFNQIETIVFDGPTTKFHLYFPGESGSATFAAKSLDDLVKAEDQLEYAIIHDHPLVDLSEYLK